jgi:haloalkane dehalogenase
MNPDQAISADFPFESRYVEVEGSRIHYVEQGVGDPIVFLHGNPTSSYLWRNIIPYAARVGRAIAPDLIGMGKSDKPDIEYSFFDHVRYVEGFIRKLDLERITFVVHDWGSALGFHYAMRHESNVKGIAFMEAILHSMRWDAFPPGFKVGFKLFRTPGIGWFMIAVMNVLVEQVMPKATVRKLGDREKAYYREPFKTVRSRRPVWRWPNEIPIDGKPADVFEAVSSYSEKLQRSELPKLLFHATPGGIIDEAGVEWAKRRLKNLTTVHIGRGIHYLQEDNPHLIGAELEKWCRD